MMHINKADVSFGENRVLAKWHGFINEDKSINYNFGADFNNWFNDRFGLRKVLIPLYKSIELILTQQPKNGLIDKETGFLYVNYELNFIDIDIIKENFKEYFKLQEWADKNKIKLYFLIVPNKTSIYTPADFKISPHHNDFINYLTQINQSNIIYPYQELLEGKKKDYVFFKTEHHWNDYGAFMGYQSLMKEIKKDYPKARILNEDDFNFFYDKKIRGDFERKFSFGQSSTYLGLSSKLKKKYHQTDYRYFKHKDFDNLSVKVIDEDFHKEKLYYYPKGANLRVIQLGTSMNENLDEFLPFSFKNVKRIRNNNVKSIPPEDEFKIMKYYEKEILDYKPDILIYCLTYWNLYGLKDTFIKD